MEFEFPLSIDSIDNVPEQYRGLYEPQEDGTALIIKPLADRMPPGEGAAATLDRLRREADGAKRSADKWKSILKADKPEEVVARIAELDGKANKAAGAEEQVEQARRDITESMQGQVDSERSAKERYRDLYYGERIGNSSALAIAKHKGNPDLLMPIIERAARMVEDGDDVSLRVIGPDGEPLMNGKGQYLDVEGFVQKLSTDQRYEAAFEATAPRGTGTQPGTGSRGPTAGGRDNPFQAGPHFNLTRQQEIIKESPERARNLALAAGVTPNWQQ